MLACLLVPLIGACQGPQHLDTEDLPELERVIAVQNDRVTRLKVLESSGTIELRTSSEDGSTQFEDCALEFWRDGPRMALRARKLGERFLWVGTDGRQWWVFQLSGGPVRVIIQPVGVGQVVLLDDGASMSSPSQLLQLAGLEPMVAIEGLTTITRDAPGVIRLDTATDAHSTWERLRWFLDEKTLLPRRIQALDGDGGVLFDAQLSGYEPIPARDTPIGGWPDFPRKVRVSDGRGDSDVRIFFNRPSARGTGIKPALFDLDRLMESFRPVEVKYVEQ